MGAADRQRDPLVPLTGLCASVGPASFLIRDAALLINQTATSSLITLFSLAMHTYGLSTSAPPPLCSLQLPTEARPSLRNTAWFRVGRATIYPQRFCRSMRRLWSLWRWTTMSVGPRSTSNPDTAARRIGGVWEQCCMRWRMVSRRSSQERSAIHMQRLLSTMSASCLSRHLCIALTMAAEKLEV